MTTKTRLSVLLRWMTACWVMALLAIPITPAAAEDGISFNEFSIQSTNGNNKQLVANMQLDYDLNSYLRNALLNGLTLENEISFELQWHNAWWFNDSKKIDNIKAELKYHSLSQHYQLLRLDTGEHWNFPSLASALGQMGKISQHNLPTLPGNAFHNNAAIFVTATLKPKSLELPLKIQSLFSDNYSLDSEGVMWPIP